jgi:hypothetical protein
VPYQSKTASRYTVDRQRFQRDRRPTTGRSTRFMCTTSTVDRPVSKPERSLARTRTRLAASVWSAEFSTAVTRTARPVRCEIAVDAAAYNGAEAVWRQNAPFVVWRHQHQQAASSSSNRRTEAAAVAEQAIRHWAGSCPSASEIDDNDVA